ncbi:hypothetical protein [Aminobacter aminovorans]|uniref:Uncharacterized protein n=1 Tax=Aminobacter aminovorans TaxID=83263 RepID=A0AAC9AQV2_AMIAI|nr:hypothetical protein [Aminobacter aminovorans]AMS41174.1 hypothetical protein AA2016_2246 [Aminobacter aminovorans]MBB3705843.1 hypothetical protein [Aminobacter aminovorans]
MKNTFKITVGSSPVTSSVELNGVRLDGVVRVAFDLDGRNKTFLKLEIMGEAVVEGEYVDRVIASTEGTYDEMLHGEGVGRPILPLL